MKTAEDWRKEWPDAGECDDFEMCAFVRAIQADAQNSTNDPRIPTPCGKHGMPRRWVQRCSMCDDEFLESVKKADRLEGGK